MLETDFPVIEEEPNKKTLIPSEQKKMDWLQNKGNLKLLILRQKRLIFPFLVSTENDNYIEHKHKHGGNFDTFTSFELILFFLYLRNEKSQQRCLFLLR